MDQATTLRTIINELVKHNLLPPHATEQIAETLAIPSKEVTTGWFVSILIGVSAWLSVILFIVFLFLIQLLDTASSTIGVGTILIIGTVFFNYTPKNTLFFSQLALALNLTGQVLFVVGIAVETDDSIVAALATAILAILLLSIYQDSIIRFLSVLTVTAAVVVLLYEFELYQAVHLLILALAIGAIWCWLKESQHQTNEMMVKLYPSLGYGLVVVWFALLLPSILPQIIAEITIINWWFSTIGLVILLLGVEYYLLRSNHLSPTSLNSTILLVGTFLVGLLFYQAPGIIAAIIVMILGFQRGNRVLMGLALGFFTLFLVAYYYHLEITLLMKSITLISTGLALLGLRWLLRQLPQTGEV